MDKKERGTYYENLAVEYLKSCKYKILEKNFKTQFGEIDIIAYDKKDNCIVFVEVRYRKNISYGTPEETVNFYKQMRLSKSAVVYIKSCSEEQTKFNYRFDVVAFTEDNKINHIKNAFVINYWYI